ncbi:zinc-finger homeodomain protein 6-like [Musa acuminata AAA Group]|uniref:zinc-finger homeodomain protein 6-like n=1 Tax=Musa acuminata AAA Group TaxID=214697 RepID=UPI0031E0AD66
MEFRNPGEMGIPSSSSGYNASLGVRSAFSKPTLSPSSSLVSPRGAAVDGGGVGGGPRNGDILGNTKPSNLVSNLIALDHRPGSLGNNADQASISNSSPGAAGVGVSVNSEPAASATTTVTAADIPTKYKECLRNHAAALGGHVVDGCGEFLPNGDPDTPEALKCAACGCHRSFHRRETEGGANAVNSYYHGTTRPPLLLPLPHPQAQLHHHQKHFQLGGFSSSPSPALPGSPGFVHFGGNNPSGNGGTTTESSSEEMIDTGTPTPSAMPKKRFRTKFTAEQKEKMLAFAERWRIQRQDDAVVEQFCSEIGVRRQVLKVWMHNNKHMITRKQQQRQQL